MNCNYPRQILSRLDKYEDSLNKIKSFDDLREWNSNIIKSRSYGVVAEYWDSSFVNLVNFLLTYKYSPEKIIFEITLSHNKSVNWTRFLCTITDLGVDKKNYQLYTIFNVKLYTNPNYTDPCYANQAGFNGQSGKILYKYYSSLLATQSPPIELVGNERKDFENHFSSYLFPAIKGYTEEITWFPLVEICLDLIDKGNNKIIIY